MYSDPTASLNRAIYNFLPTRNRLSHRRWASESQPIVRTRWVGVTLLLLLIAGVICLYFYYAIQCIDGCGPYHNRASAADLDGDGDGRLQAQN